MRPEELREEISFELGQMERIVQELRALYQEVEGREPTIRERAAAAAFLAQFYNGVENILKRISRFYGVPLPRGESWHVELFTRFCEPPYGPLPALFDQSLASALAPFRRFRHVFFHGYSFELDWERMSEGIRQVESVFERFKKAISVYLESV
ncbi:MAG: hypothetical protein N3B68_08590 [Anaerolineae bacterium]|nr:hypothetical protein [Anaerolineae bacterium]